MFRKILTVNSDYFLKQRYRIDLCNGEVRCLLRGTDWILKYYLDDLGPMYSNIVGTEASNRDLCRGAGSEFALRT
jgi:hypothetical protein